MATKPQLSQLSRNKDGSYNSVCPKCFATVARSKSKTELYLYHQSHVCESAFLAERGTLTPAHSLTVLP